MVFGRITMTAIDRINLGKGLIYQQRENPKLKKGIREFIPHIKELNDFANAGFEKGLDHKVFDKIKRRFTLPEVVNESHEEFNDRCDILMRGAFAKEGPGFQGYVSGIQRIVSEIWPIKIYKENEDDYGDNEDFKNVMAFFENELKKENDCGKPQLSHLDKLFREILTEDSSKSTKDNDAEAVAKANNDKKKLIDASAGAYKRVQSRYDNLVKRGRGLKLPYKPMDGLKEITAESLITDLDALSAQTPKENKSLGNKIKALRECVEKMKNGEVYVVSPLDKNSSTNWPENYDTLNRFLKVMNNLEQLELKQYDEELKKYKDLMTRLIEELRKSDPTHSIVVEVDRIAAEAQAAAAKRTAEQPKPSEKLPEPVAETPSNPLQNRVTQIESNSAATSGTAPTPRRGCCTWLQDLLQRIWDIITRCFRRNQTT